MTARYPAPSLRIWFSLALAAVAGCGADEEPAVPAAPSESGVVILTEAQRTRAGISVRAVSPTEIAVPVSVPAEVNPPDTSRALVGSIVEGRVERLRVLPGDPVEVGDVMVLIHSHEMLDARRDLDAARAEMDYAERALARSLELLAAGAVSREEVERRTADRDAAAAELRRGEEMMRHLDPSSEGDVTVRAPRTGVVLQVFVEPSSTVLPGDALVEVGALTPLWATAHLPEDLAARLRPGGQARVTLQAYPGDTLQARLVRVGGRVDPATRTVEVRVEVLDAPAGARPGMFARVELLEADTRIGVELPGEAVQQVDGEPSVFVEEEPGRYRAVPVQLQPLAGGALLVTGLGEAVRVVVGGAPFLKATADRGGEVEDQG